jgi:ubiquinone biosynthesis protein COQ9
MTKKKKTQKKPAAKTTGAKSGAAKKQPPSLKDRILEAALPDVAFDGWDASLFTRAEKRLGLEPGAAEEAFPDGALGLVLHFSDWANRKMLEKLPPQKLETMRVRDKIAAGVEARLAVLAPHKQAVSAALAYLAPPPRNLYLPRLVWRTADELWRRAGDTSTDYNHYTKRILLSGVLTSTTLYWLNDKSDGHEKTSAFLSRRIDNVLKVGQKLGGILKKKQGKA